MTITEFAELPLKAGTDASTNTTMSALSPFRIPNEHATDNPLARRRST